MTITKESDSILFNWTRYLPSPDLMIIAALWCFIAISAMWYMRKAYLKNVQQETYVSGAHSSNMTTAKKPLPR